MQFIDGKRLVLGRPQLPVLHPDLITPGELLQVPDDGGIVRTQL